jgi:tetratricopeptide (TPR) repeat protein
MKRLGSLGYVSRSTTSRKENFGPQDDVKTLLPFHNKVFEAMTLYGKGKKEDTIALLKDIIRKREDIGIAYYRLGFVYMDQGKVDDALEILRQGLSNVPDDYDLYRNYIKTLSRAKRFDEIIENFHEKGYKEISMDPEIWNDLGSAYAGLSDRQKAIESYEKALSLDSRYAEAHYNLGDVYLTQAIEDRNLNLVKVAEESFKKSIQADPRYPAPYLGLGQAFRIMRESDQAIANLKKAVALQPDFDAAYYYLGLTHLEKGEKSQALECFTTIKEKFYPVYSEEQKRRIDELIKKCKDEI